MTRKRTPAFPADYSLRNALHAYFYGVCGQPVVFQTTTTKGNSK